MKLEADIIIVGAGISGATLAERYANIGKNVLIIEKRDHIGGNCYDFINESGVRISKYGAHLFHTNFHDVWSYVQRFSEWYFYEHRVKAFVDQKIVPVPVNITTINTLLNHNMQNAEQMKKWLKENTIQNDKPKNAKEAAYARVGPYLFEKIFRNYTKKQWNRGAEDLDASVLNRIPIHVSFDDRYFTDIYQYLPAKGYTALFEKMLSHPRIKILLNTDFFTVKNRIRSFEKLFYTGPIDQFFDFKFSVKQKLEYRSLIFEWETHKKEFYQEHAVINYPNENKFTRIVEYKHFTRQKHPYTTISKEYSVDYEPGVNEPYYPVPNPQNNEIYEAYRNETLKLPHIYFVGRLANYKYFNMDQAFKNALDLFYSLENVTDYDFEDVELEHLFLQLRHQKDRRLKTA